jgi:putative addiction module component (TIGR02574 family)
VARPLKELESELMDLPPEERAQLLHKLMLSLGEGVEEAVNAYWLAELQRRKREAEAKKAELIPVQETLKKARDALKRR